jgi:hypothetical protein
MSIRHAGEVAFIQHQFSTHSIEFYRAGLLGKIISRHSPLIPGVSARDERDSFS